MMIITAGRKRLLLCFAKVYSASVRFDVTQIETKNKQTNGNGIP